MSDNPSAPDMAHPFDIKIDSTRHISFGMTLRDYFAGQAITICLKDLSLGPDAWAREAYAVADAMIAARVQP